MMKSYNIAVLGGDGIGPEVTAEAVKVLQKTASVFGLKFNFSYYDVGGCSVDRYGVPITDEAFLQVQSSDAVLLGAVGGTKWDKVEKAIRPEQALFRLRGGLGLYANLRPIILFEELKDACPIRPEIIGKGLDIMIVRELTGGVYFGKKWTKGDTANDLMSYSRHEIERIIDIAIDIAGKRRKKITSVDKANVLETSRLWRRIFEEKTSKLEDYSLNSLLVDNAAMQLIRNPAQFDVIVTENLFVDILSDEASMLTGSIGMLPSASLGKGNFGMYEPIHGSAPDIAGKSIANPIASILSAAMMLRHTFNLCQAADKIEYAVKAALSKGARTLDIIKKGEKPLSTVEMGDEIVRLI